MEIKIFTDFIDAIGKVATGLKALANLPKNERDKYRQTMDEAFRLIDTTINMVIFRLGDVLFIENDNYFLAEISKLDYYKEWVEAERELRLCKSLRAASRETESLRSLLSGELSTNDWDALLEQMRAVLAAEHELAEFISQQFQGLAESVRNATPDPQLMDTIKMQVNAFRAVLVQERRQLLKQEIEQYEIV